MFDTNIQGRKRAKLDMLDVSYQDMVGREMSSN